MNPCKLDALPPSRCLAGDSPTYVPRIVVESEEKVDGRACVSASFSLCENHCEDLDLCVRFAKYNKVCTRALNLYWCDRASQSYSYYDAKRMTQGNECNFSTAPKSFHLLRQLQDSLHFVEEASYIVAQHCSSPFPLPDIGLHTMSSSSSAFRLGGERELRGDEFVQLLPYIRHVR